MRSLEDPQEDWGAETGKLVTQNTARVMFWNELLILLASLIAQVVKNMPAMQETLVQFLGLEDPLEKG